MPAELSIIVPVYNEGLNVLPLAKEVAAAFAGYEKGYELVFVDDASTDDTWSRIQEANVANPVVHGLLHDRNAGQSAALWTGIQHTSTPLIATLDGDLQNDPADLRKMLADLDACDFVCGHRVQRQDSFIRRVSSGIARKARKWVLGSDIADTGCAIRVFRRESIEGLFGFNGLHRFLPILVEGGGHRVREVPVNHRPRTAGVSKYGIGNRLWRGIADLFAIAWYQRRRLKSVRPAERISGH